MDRPSFAMHACNTSRPVRGGGRQTEDLHKNTTDDEVTYDVSTLYIHTRHPRQVSFARLRVHKHIVGHIGPRCDLTGDRFAFEALSVLTDERVEESKRTLSRQNVSSAMEGGRDTNAEREGSGGELDLSKQTDSSDDDCLESKNHKDGVVYAVDCPVFYNSPTPEPPFCGCDPWRTGDTANEG